MGGKFTIFALFYFVLEGKFQVQAPGALIFLYSEGRLHEGAYFRNFYGICFLTFFWQN